MELNVEYVKKAYLFLKSYAYHENLNLFLKQRVAKFEVKKFEQSLSIITDLVNSEGWESDSSFKSWLKNVGYHLLPKAVCREEDVIQNSNNGENGLFITNVRASDTYQVSKVNYFINAPVELHIIEMLWSMVVGPILDNKLTKDCYGNRLHPSIKKHIGTSKAIGPNDIFKRYIEQYNQWRDQAIEIATGISSNGEDVALLSLDLKAYFYHIDWDSSIVLDMLEEYFGSGTREYHIAVKLTLMLDEIHRAYYNKIKKHIKHTHQECNIKRGLPIGFASSSIIANWYLLDFDNSVLNEAMPAYYGRYVDDIIMVFRRPQMSSTNQIEEFINHYLSTLLKNSEEAPQYYIEVKHNKSKINNRLPIQKDKLILQFFDRTHSRAGLEIFKQELDERSSAFKFLPNEHFDKELDKFAYDLLYQGSVNTLRSVVGLAENETELAKYLSSHITAQRLCKLDRKDSVLPQLQRFFKGQNGLRFCRLWEKVYQYAIVINNHQFINYFYKYLDREIIKIIGVASDMGRDLSCAKEITSLTTKLRKDLSIYNSLSLSLSVGLLDLKSISEAKVIESEPKSVLKDLLHEFNLKNYAECFRKSNLIRHHLVAWPLANYSNYKGDLTKEESFVECGEFKVDALKLELSPRFIHFDEWQLFHISSYLSADKTMCDWVIKTKEAYKEKFFGDNFSFGIKTCEEDNSNIIKTRYTIGNNNKSKGKLKLAIANMYVCSEDIESSLRKDKKPNVSFSRQENLYQILNASIKEQADILVMPEVAIPVSWLPFMVSFSRRHQIAIIFGLEHWVVDGRAYNLIIEALPFQVSNKYKSCTVLARLKNHYAPAESSLIDSLRLRPGNESIKPKAYYHNVKWRGANFTTYNCFELSDITHRVLFKSEIDLLFACVWNKDTNYYQHILESTVRDLHCYTVQSNTSQYGGSCVLRPCKTENKTMLYVKGGENSCVLTTEIDIASLRAFQFKSNPNGNDKFKYLPPGFSHDLVLKR